MSLPNFSRRSFLILGAGAASVAWLSAPDPATAAPGPSGAAFLELPHNTLLGVL